MSFKVLNFFINKLNKCTFFGSLSRNGFNFYGRICVFHRGGRNAFKYRVLDFYRRLNEFCYVYKKIHDSSRSAFVGFLLANNGLLFNVILSDGVSLGDSLFLGDDPKTINKFLYNINDLKGSAVPLKYFSIFSVISNIELRPFFGSVLARSAGVRFFVVSLSKQHFFLKSPSGWTISVSSKCLASVGNVSNPSWNYQVIGKAGKNRGLGRRPVVRG